MGRDALPPSPAFGQTRRKRRRKWVPHSISGCLFLLVWISSIRKCWAPRTQENMVFRSPEIWWSTLSAQVGCIEVLCLRQDSPTVFSGKISFLPFNSTHIINGANGFRALSVWGLRKTMSSGFGRKKNTAPFPSKYPATLFLASWRPSGLLLIDLPYLLLLPSGALADRSSATANPRPPPNGTPIRLSIVFNTLPNQSHPPSKLTLRPNPPSWAGPTFPGVGGVLLKAETRITGPHNHWQFVILG